MLTCLAAPFAIFWAWWWMVEGTKDPLVGGEADTEQEGFSFLDCDASHPYDPNTIMGQIARQAEDGDLRIPNTPGGRSTMEGFWRSNCQDAEREVDRLRKEIDALRANHDGLREEADRARRRSDRHHVMLVKSQEENHRIREEMGRMGREADRLRDLALSDKRLLHRAHWEVRADGFSEGWDAACERMRHWEEAASEDGWSFENRKGRPLSEAFDEDDPGTTEFEPGQQVIITSWHKGMQALKCREGVTGEIVNECGSGIFCRIRTKYGVTLYPMKKYLKLIPQETSTGGS